MEKKKMKAREMEKKAMGLGAAFGMIAARNRDFRNNKNSPDFPLKKKKMKAREMEKKANELDKAKNPDTVTGQTLALA